MKTKRGANETVEGNNTTKTHVKNNALNNALTKTLFLLFT